MSYTRSISAFSALLILVNTSIGAGVFINLSTLLGIGGTGSFVAYLGGALLLLPVVMTIASLAAEHPHSGGLYVYNKEYLSPFMGFLSGWSYFLGKSVSTGLLIHIFMAALAEVFPVLDVVPSVVRDGIAIFTIIGINILGVSIDGRAQKVLIVSKLVPIFFIAGTLIYNFSTLNTTVCCTFSDVPMMLPVAIFAMVGFELMTSITHLVAASNRGIYWIMVGGFLLVASFLSFFQFSGSFLALLAGSLGKYPFATLGSYYFSGITGRVIGIVVTLFVYLSIFGGAFGILTSNCWNVYTLAREGFLPGKKFLTLKTQKQVPWVSLLFEGCISVIALAISAEKVPLQNVAVLGIVAGYCLTILASFFAKKKDGSHLIAPIITAAAFTSTGYVLYLVIDRIYTFGISFPVFGLFLCGVAIAFVKKRLSAGSFLSF